MKLSTILEWVINNKVVIISIIAIIILATIKVIRFSKLPKNEQFKKIKKCLLGWVIDAERELGGGTGKVKLSVVYSYFVQSFPIIKSFVSFETFSDWVDDALEEMRKMLEENKQLKTVVESTQLEVTTKE